MTYDATGTAGAGTGVGDQSPTDQAKERASEMAGQAQEKAREALETQVDQRSGDAADKVESVAEDVRAVSESLSDRGQDSAARIVEQGADYAQQLSDYLRSSSSQQILDDVAGFARRQPWAVAAGGLLVGFAASRVLRASAVSSGSSTMSGSSHGYRPATAPSTYPSGTYASPTSDSAFGPATTYGASTYESTDPAANQFPAPVTSSVDGR